MIDCIVLSLETKGFGAFHPNINRIYESEIFSIRPPSLIQYIRYGIFDRSVHFSGVSSASGARNPL